MKNQNSKFQSGTGCFKCEVCGRMTRLTGNNNEHTCPECYELGGLENWMSDDKAGAIEANVPANIAELKAIIISKGGKIS